MFRSFFWKVISALVFIGVSGTTFAIPISGGIAPMGVSFDQQEPARYSPLFANEGSQQHASASTAITTGSGGHAAHQFALSLPVQPPTQHVPETPEPSTLTLFGSGLIIAGSTLRRKFRR